MQGPLVMVNMNTFNKVCWYGQCVHSQGELVNWCHGAMVQCVQSQGELVNWCIGTMVQSQGELVPAVN